MFYDSPYHRARNSRVSNIGIARDYISGPKPSEDITISDIRAKIRETKSRHELKMKEQQQNNYVEVKDHCSETDDNDYFADKPIRRRMRRADQNKSDLNRDDRQTFKICPTVLRQNHFQEMHRTRTPTIQTEGSQKHRKLLKPTSPPLEQ